MDPIKQIQQRERRAKAKAESLWAKIESTPKYKEEKMKLEALIKKKKDRKDYLHEETIL
jgi:hypothetical protein